MQKAPRQLTFHDHRMRTGRGGPRSGAGRPRGPRPLVYHVRRSPVPRNLPSHVTIRVRAGVPRLRVGRFVREFRRTLSEARERRGFRVVHYSIQGDHIYFILEAAGKEALGCGMKSISARVARAVQRVFGLTGPVLAGRYHLHVLRSRREVRNALAYVLLNARRHWKKRYGVAPPVKLDEASSGGWFDGWKRGWRAPAPGRGREVAPPRTWMLQKGWRMYGLVDPAEVPG